MKINMINKGLSCNTRNKIRDLILTLYIFIFLFGPPFFYKTNYILALISLSYLIIHNGKFLWIVKKSKMILWIRCITVLTLYSLLVIGFNDILAHDLVNKEHYISLFNRYYVFTLIMLSCGSFTIYIIRKWNYTWDDFIEILVFAALIESALTLLSFFNPRIKQIFIFLMSKYGGLSLDEWFFTVRAYGFASTLVDLFGLCMGIIAGISFLYGFNVKKTYIIYSFIVLVAGVLNARTTVIIYLIAIMISVLTLITHLKIVKLLKIVSIVLIITGIFYYLLINVVSTTSPTGGWIKEGFIGILDLITGNNSSKKDFSTYLVSAEKWKMPSGIRLLLGTGHSRYEAQGYIHSDIGYVNDIWFIGLIGASILYGTFIIIGLYAIKKGNTLQRKCVSFVLISAFVFNIKGCVIGGNMGTWTIFLLLYVTNMIKTSGNICKAYLNDYLEFLE